jgi:hypothetical protein
VAFPPGLRRLKESSASRLHNGSDGQQLAPWGWPADPSRQIRVFSHQYARRRARHGVLEWAMSEIFLAGRKGAAAPTRPTWPTRSSAGFAGIVEGLHPGVDLAVAELLQDVL